MSFLPPDIRAPLRSYWYRDAPNVNTRYPLNSGTQRPLPTAVHFQSNFRSESDSQNLQTWRSVQAEFYSQLYGSRLTAKVLGQSDLINATPVIGEIAVSVNSTAEFEAELRKVVSQPATRLPFSGYLDDTAYLHLVVDGGSRDRVYTLVRNKEHFNIASILGERGRRDPANDSLNILPGYQASYPNRFFVVELREAASFLRQLQSIHSQSGIRDLIGHYGISRQDPAFWRHYDWFVHNFAVTRPTESGAIDLIRYGNAEPLPEDDENANQ